MATTIEDGVIITDVPNRLDRLPWSRWHWLVVLALGITWVLDGLEVTVVNAVADVLKRADTLGLTTVQVASAASAYVAGAAIGALFFGYLTDRLGRKKLFLVTLGWYVTFSVLTAFAWDVYSYDALRVLTGIGIGGEYAAINSAIDELIPARRRGWTDLAINSSYWWGAILASALSLFLLDRGIVPVSIGWRLCFLLGGVLGVGILLVRRAIPESPRWLITHGRPEEAEEIVRDIERQVEAEKGPLPPIEGEPIAIDLEHRVRFWDMPRTMFRTYPQRTSVCLALMITQAFLYDAIFFTESLVLTTFFHVPDDRVGLFLVPFALGNVLGPWVLGHLFDSVGRRPMIAGTYIISGVLLVITGILFTHGVLTATTITVCWSVIFFFASAGASSAYLTVSEVFPMETRALAIAFVYSIGNVVGGIAAPLLFGALIATRQPGRVFIGYCIGAGLMIFGGLVEAIWGVDAERRSLESIAAPLSSVRRRLKAASSEAAAAIAAAASVPTLSTQTTLPGAPTGGLPLSSRDPLPFDPDRPPPR
ncbi:MAG TPA: MFS transporter [Candidatus Dormibacteraeota bacterium]|nr:MFS transporter [Candidatus Dormibacteraeota bacterium]